MPFGGTSDGDDDSQPVRDRDVEATSASSCAASTGRAIDDAPAPGRASRPRMIYLDGDLCSCRRRFIHERLAERLGLFVMVVVDGLDIPCIPAGQTTFRRRKKRGGRRGGQDLLPGQRRADPRQGRDRPAHRPAARPGDRGRPHPRGDDGRRGLSPARRARGLVCDEEARDPGPAGRTAAYAGRSRAGFPFLTASRSTNGSPARSTSDDRMVKELRAGSATRWRPRPGPAWHARLCGPIEGRYVRCRS